MNSIWIKTLYGGYAGRAGVILRLPKNPDGKKFVLSFYNGGHDDIQGNSINDLKKSADFLLEAK